MWPMWEQSHLLNVCASTSIQREWLAVKPPSSHLSYCTHSPGLSVIKSTDLMGLSQRTLRPYRSLEGPSAHPAVRKTCPSNPQPLLLSPPAVPKHLAPWHALNVWPCVLHFSSGWFPRVWVFSNPGNKAQLFLSSWDDLAAPWPSISYPPASHRENSSPGCPPVFL